MLLAVCEPPALVASWSASAEESASWSVLACWLSNWAWPEPPHPAPQLSLLDWVWSASWFGSSVFDAEELAELVRSWVAELSPAVTLPPEYETGALALTPF